MKKLDNILFDPHLRKFWANVNGSLVEINNSNDLKDVYTKAEVDKKVANAGKTQSVSVNGGTPQEPGPNGNVDLQIGILSVIIETEEDGFFLVDENLNIGGYATAEGSNIITTSIIGESL